MNFAVSTSCFYPLETETALQTLGELGIERTELFFNARSEASEPFVSEIARMKEEHSMSIISGHGYAAFAEGYFLFSPYKRRFFDFLEESKAVFESEAKLGAKFHILHGLKAAVPITPEQYAERLAAFIDLGEQFGVTVLQENVVNYHSGSIEFMQCLASLLGSNFSMVLDNKQARRAGVDAFDFFRALAPHVKHLHVSDFSAESDCTIPGENGLFDFKRYFLLADELNYSGDAVLEVYRCAYSDPTQLLEGQNYLQKIYDTRYY